jgi:hypothetical protein
MIQLQAFQSLPFARPYCPECAAPMFIVPAEPGAGDHTPTFECPVCRFSDTVAIRC